MPPRRGNNFKAGLISIGINYLGTSNQLGGCINDSINITRLARQQLGRHLRYVHRLSDDQRGRNYPNKANIEQALKRGVQLLRQRRLQKLIIHYSGHGTQVFDRNGDEADRLDEALVPADFSRAGVITDDWLLANVVQQIPRNTQMLALLDCCHSGSIMDLKYNLQPIKGGRKLKRRAVKKGVRDTAGKAVMISGCIDSSYSYDTYDPKYKASGAMSVSFIRAVLRGRKRPIGVIVEDMRRQLRAGGYPQVPQLSTSIPVNDQQRLPAFGN